MKGAPSLRVVYVREEGKDPPLGRFDFKAVRDTLPRPVFFLGDVERELYAEGVRSNPSMRVRFSHPLSTMDRPSSLFRLVARRGSGDGVDRGRVAATAADRELDCFTNDRQCAP